MKLTKPHIIDEIKIHNHQLIEIYCKDENVMIVISDAIDAVTEIYTPDSLIGPGSYPEILGVIQKQHLDYDMFYTLVRYAVGLKSISQVKKKEIVSDIMSYRQYCLDQYAQQNILKTVNWHNARRFLNKYKNSIVIFGLHGGKSMCKENLRFINSAWRFCKQKEEAECE